MGPLLGVDRKRLLARCGGAQNLVRALANLGEDERRAVVAAAYGQLHEPQHMKLVGDELHVREIPSEAAVAVRQVERDPSF